MQGHNLFGMFLRRLGLISTLCSIILTGCAEPSTYQDYSALWELEEITLTPAELGLTKETISKETISIAIEERPLLAIYPSGSISFFPGDFHGFCGLWGNLKSSDQELELGAQSDIFLDLNTYGSLEYPPKTFDISVYKKIPAEIFSDGKTLTVSLQINGRLLDYLDSFKDNRSVKTKNGIEKFIEATSASKKIKTIEMRFSRKRKFSNPTSQERTDQLLIAHGFWGRKCRVDKILPSVEEILSLRANPNGTIMGLDKPPIVFQLVGDELETVLNYEVWDNYEIYPDSRRLEDKYTTLAWYGGDLDVNYRGLTPLGYTVQKKDFFAVEALLEAGASAKTKTRWVNREAYSESIAVGGIQELKLFFEELDGSSPSPSIPEEMTLLEGIYQSKAFRDHCSDHLIVDCGTFNSDERAAIAVLLLDNGAEFDISLEEKRKFKSALEGVCKEQLKISLSFMNDIEVHLFRLILKNDRTINHTIRINDHMLRAIYTGPKAQSRLKDPETAKMVKEYIVLYDQYRDKINELCDP